MNRKKEKIRLVKRKHPSFNVGSILTGILLVSLFMSLFMSPVYDMHAFAKTGTEEIDTDDGFNGAAGGDGSLASPYLISTTEQFIAFRDYINGTGAHDGNAHTGMGEFFKLTADIDLGGSEDNQWMPIGADLDPEDDFGFDGTAFSGTFDGDGHMITGLYINASEESFKGLFGLVKGGTVKNLGVDGTVTGYRYVGSVIGFDTGSIVTNCYSTGSVTGEVDVGGVVGYNNNTGTVTDCYNTGFVTGIIDVGGVVGDNYDSTAAGCHNDGFVTGRDNVGGVVGCNNYKSMVTSSYNTGEVTGSRYVGGVVGDNDYTVSVFTPSKVRNCYNTGKVMGTSDVGGVVGFNISSKVENCHNSGEVMGSDYDVGGVVGWNYINSTAANCYNTGFVTGREKVGGVAGSNYHDSTVTNCYYLAGTADYGIGSVSGDEGAEKLDGKSNVLFAWLMSLSVLELINML